MTRFPIFLSILFSFICPYALNAQTVIQMVADQGVYKVPCEVNGLKVKMVFDTGAAAVSISENLAEMMLENGYLSPEDLGNKAKAITADGRIVDNTLVVLKTVKIGDITLSDVAAVVIDGQRTPLLFGQSAIQKLGQVSMKGDKLYIYGSTPSESISGLYERWDANTYQYSNYTYGFHWNLPKDFEWERQQGQEQHTPFRAQGTPFTVFVNAQVANNPKDLWSVYDQYTAMVEQADLAMEKKTGLLAYERTFEKCTLLGQHAIKTTFKEYFKDSRFKEPIESYAEEYIVVANGYTFIIAVKIPKVVYDSVDCSEAISDVFKGFKFTIKH